MPSAVHDVIDDEIMLMFAQLTPDQKREAVAFAASLLDSYLCNPSGASGGA